MPTSVIGASSLRPPMWIAPSVAGVRPAAISISVLLPQPEGPISDTNSPPAIANDTSSIAVNGRALPGKRFVIPCPSIEAPPDVVAGRDVLSVASVTRTSADWVEADRRCSSR